MSTYYNIFGIGTLAPSTPLRVPAWYIEIESYSGNKLQNVAHIYELDEVGATLLLERVIWYSCMVMVGMECGMRDHSNHMFKRGKETSVG